MDRQKKRDFIVDNILVELGELGRYQLLQYFFYSTIIVITTLAIFSYVFTAGQLEYRCKIPNCDRATDVRLEYETEWLHLAVPFNGDGKPALCQRYQYLGDISLTEELRCSQLAFNQSVIENCDEFVFASDELTIVNEFNVTCEDKEWLLALIGSVGFAADLCVQPFCAYFSDKYGRRPVLIATLLLGGICGLIKSFSVSYVMFAAMELLTAFVSGGSYMTVFIMAIESATPTKRVFSGTLITFMCSFSQVLCGCLAMLLPNFRTLLQVLYAPNLLILTYVWMVPESVRWLLVNGKAEAAKSIFMKAANMNKITLSSGPLESLESTLPQDQNETTHKLNENPRQTDSFLAIFQSRILAIRLMVCMVVWFMIKFIYYGMTIQSVSLAGNKYLNFILVNGVELPAIVLSSLLMQWMGRKWAIIGALLLTCVACVATGFIPEDAWLAQLLVYLIGKCCITIAFSTNYVFSSEQFPTSLRHSTMIACYIVGTLGSIFSPFTMLLVSTWRSLPLIIFGSSALLSGILVCILPETKNTRLPDTISEAEQLTTFSMSQTKGKL